MRALADELDHRTAQHDTALGEASVR